MPRAVARSAGTALPFSPLGTSCADAPGSVSGGGGRHAQVGCAYRPGGCDCAQEGADGGAGAQGGQHAEHAVIGPAADVAHGGRLTAQAVGLRQRQVGSAARRGAADYGEVWSLAVTSRDVLLQCGGTPVR